MSLPSRTAYFDSDSFLLHLPGAGHPERRERLLAVREGLSAHNLETKLLHLQPQAVDRRTLERVHHPEHVRAVEAVCQRGGGQLDADTYVVAASWQAALQAAGAVVDAVHAIGRGDIDRAFCAVRPPGHHALSTGPMGFCLFDNIAVGAQAAIDSGLAKRVAILDWDVHHGNGTQEIFYERADVFFASWHQFPFYPGSGARSETGAGAGLGTTLNCPLQGGAGNQQLLRAWHDEVRPALERFAPELVMVSAGFDADARDPLGGLDITAAGFEQLSSEVRRFADEYCQGRLVSVLEGGYDLQALAEDAAVHVAILL